MSTKITVTTTVQAPVSKAWDCYTNPEHIIHWNFAVPDWHCPSAVNDMRPGGTYKARMEAKDGSFGFDFEAVYAEVNDGKDFRYAFGGREAKVSFDPENGGTKVTVSFDPENENPLEMQRAGWQAILDNYARYTEQN